MTDLALADVDLAGKFFKTNSFPRFSVKNSLRYYRFLFYVSNVFANSE